MVEIFKALGDENRMRIINLLIDANMCVGEMEIILKINQSNLSRHLSKLKTARIITSDKDAQWVYYKLSNGFREENQKLLEYLRENLSKDSSYKKDKERYFKYKEKGLTCQCITKDREKVIKTLEEV